MAKTLSTLLLTLILSSSQAQLISFSPFHIGRKPFKYCYALDSTDHCHYFIDSVKQKNNKCSAGYSTIKPKLPTYPDETCNGIDDNCNGQIDEGFAVTVQYIDLDKDGAGNPSVSKSDCKAIEGYVTNSIDCNDNDRSIITPISYYVDNDNDGHGGNKITILCSFIPPLGYSVINDDCNDFDAAVHPGLAEVCNGVDDNCNGTIDEGLPQIQQWLDNDGDGYGSATTISDCNIHSGYVTNSLDCNDNDRGINPNAFELFNEIDDNCNGQTDEGCTNPYTNSYCDELTQWDRSHVDISMYSEPFNANYTKFHSGFGTFTNGIASVHFLSTNPASANGFNFSVCRPYPNNTQTCANQGGNTQPKDCSGDGLGCYTHNFDYYPQLCQYYAEHHISMIVNINPYEKKWSVQKQYIDIPLSFGVNVIGVIFGTELAVGSWYANSYYYPNGGKDYSVTWKALKDSVHKYYPLPIGIWTGDIWDLRGYAFVWNNDIALTAQSADFLAPYGQNQNIMNRSPVVYQDTTQVESQVIDSVLKFSWWFDKWQSKLFTKYGIKKVAILTNGTDAAEPQTGTTFIGVMQTEYQIMIEQMANNVMGAQEYRTRMYDLETDKAASDFQVQLRFDRGSMYSFQSHKELISTGNPNIIALKFTGQDGHGWIEVLNFSPVDWKPDFFILGGEGWSTNNLLTSLAPPYKPTYFTGTTAKARSISFFQF